MVNGFKIYFDYKLFTYGINFIKENNTSFFGSGHREEFSDHPGPLADILLNELTADDSDEASVSPVSNCTSGESLACAWRAVEQDSFGRVYAEIDELFGLEQRHLHDFFEFVELLLAATEIVVGDIGLFLDLHHSDRGVYFGREGQLDLIFVVVDSDPHTLLDVSLGHFLSQADHVLRTLFYVYHILRLRSVLVYYLRATSHHQRVFAH